MIKKAIHMAALAAMLLATAAACQQDEGLGPQSAPESDFVKLEFRADVPAPETQNVGTRAVDPDGGGVRDITLFCFDNFGLFITTATADLTSTGTTAGTFTAEVPKHTRRIHFVANQNMTDFVESMFINKSESEVMALLEGSAGHMIYWARFACAPDSDPSETIAQQIKDQQNGKITMLRNHASVTVENPTDNGKFVITGMAAYNIQAFGTVAPYDPERGFDFTLEEWKADNYVTIPQRDAKQSDIMDVTANTRQYIFEHENTSDDPVSIILRGHAPDKTANDDLYYRVMLVDADGDFIPVRRNHRYILTIKGELSFGQSTFEEAQTAAATNNVWVSISDDVNEVEDQKYILRVDQTFVVYNEAEIAGEKSQTLTYSLKGKGGTKLTMNDRPEIKWLDNTVAAQKISNELFTINGEATGATGSFSIALRDLGSNDRLEGTLLVKHGRLQRKIRIILIKQQTFVPSWIGTAVYGDLIGAGRKPFVNLIFTIPEDCPAELFPMNVYITAKQLDIRASSGVALPVVRRGDTQWYEQDGGPDADYKFVYTAERPGKHRIYFENILSQDPGYRGEVYIEAKHFETMQRTYTFANAKKAIWIENIKPYNKGEGGGGNAAALDENIYYYLVPQKAGAQAEFIIWLRERNVEVAEDEDNALGASIDPEEKDEFLFYTENLTNYDADADGGEIMQPDCRFSIYNAKAAAWMTKYNKSGGRMLMFKPKKEKLTTNKGKYSIRMFTNRARSAETVRIASNLNNQSAVSQSDPDDTNGKDTLYGGNAYRSQTFELANYNPFRFGARVRYDGGAWAGADQEPDRTTDLHKDIPEAVTPLVWTFEPDRKVDIAIDVTSFEGSDNTSVDPFGRAFEIYIDAPMLKIDESRLAECKLNAAKLKADPAVPGRFIYTVEAEREAERAFGTGDPVANKDNAPDAEAQTNERKVLPFVVGSVASAGDIVLSSNKEQIVYYDKTFRVTNESIRGNIVYEVENADGTVSQVPVPDDLFVAFERVTNSNRIGSVTMTADGQFELRLRKEYPLNWLGYPVAFHFEHGEHIHHAQYASLAEMYAALQRGETVVLKREPLNN